jgi:hypothetical protein
MKRLLTTLAACLILSSALAWAADPKVTFVDLQPKANATLEGMFEQKEGEENANPLKPGEHTLEGIKFKIGKKIICLGSMQQPQGADKVEGIKVDQAFDKLHILHACGWSTEDGTVIGEYTVTWDDDTSVTIPIRYGKDVADWWYDDNSPEPSEAKVAWKGAYEASRKAGKKTRLYLMTWENPKPDKKVARIDFSTNKQTQAAPFCVALTVEKK